MARKNRYTKKELDKIYQKLERVIKRHGKAKIVFTNHSSSEISRMRKIYANGYCEVSYNYNNCRTYGKNFSTSCFFEDHLDDVMGKFGKNSKVIKPKLKEVLKNMRRHDGSWCQILEIKYGKNFKSKMRL